MKYDPSYHSALYTTRALLKFYEEHGSEFRALRECLDALERMDRPIAEKMFRAIVRNNNLGDWWPPTVFSHETPEYAQAVFEALLCHWLQLMRQLFKISNDRRPAGSE